MHPADVLDHFEDALDGASAAAHKHVPRPGSLGGCRGGFDELIEKDHR